MQTRCLSADPLGVGDSSLKMALIEAGSDVSKAGTTGPNLHHTASHLCERFLGEVSFTSGIVHERESAAQTPQTTSVDSDVVMMQMHTLRHQLQPQ